MREHEHVGAAVPDPAQHGPEAHGDRAPDRVRQRGGDRDVAARGGEEPRVFYLVCQFVGMAVCLGWLSDKRSNSLSVCQSDTCSLSKHQSICLSPINFFCRTVYFQNINELLFCCERDKDKFINVLKMSDN